MMIGIYGILFEFWHPGAVVPGVIGGISLIVALTALSVLPVNYAGLALLLFGIALMVAEAFAPSFGIVGLGGIVAFALGALFLFDPDQSDIPIQASWQVVAGLTAVSAAFFARHSGVGHAGAAAPGADRSRGDDRQHRRGRALGRTARAASMSAARYGRRAPAPVSPRARRCAS